MRLIDVDTLKKQIEEWISEQVVSKYTISAECIGARNGAKAIIRLLNEAQTIDPIIQNIDVHDIYATIADVNPAEIASQIERDNLSNWCNVWRLVAKREVDSMINNPYTTKVKQGKWITDGAGYKCSICNEYLIKEQFEHGDNFFCFNCGAKMGEI